MRSIARTVGAEKTSGRRLLALNAGSSSLKFAVFASQHPPRLQLRGGIGGIGREQPRLKVRAADGGAVADEPVDAPDHCAALAAVWRWLEHSGSGAIDVVGHRLVHGGPRLAEPCRITPAVLAEVRAAVPFAPEHLPPEIALIEAMFQCDADRPQVACFDTAFHADLPRVARMLPLPRRLEARGIRRYGFHGLSYEFIVQELTHLEPRVAREGRAILAHLGNGASVAAVQGRRCIDTSMAATPSAGIPMSTRSGDIDPGLVALLAQIEGVDAAGFQQLVTRASGLLGIAETSGDLRVLTTTAKSDARAAEAVAFFCYQVKKCIGGYVAALGGLDTLVFTGGVGENLPSVRAGICDGLGYLGLQLDAQANAGHQPVISAAGSAVTVRVIPTDEEQMIAQAVCRLLEGPAHP